MNPQPPPQPPLPMPRPNPLFLLLLLSYFTLHVVLRVTLTPTLDYDEAEQALFAQWLLPGYSEQPPLFTWIQYGFFNVLGEKVLAISLLKNSLLFLTFVFVYLSGLRLLANGRAAMLATLSLLLIPQIGWESQRDMTHTVLVVCAAAATLLTTLRLISRQSLANYLLFALCLTAGFLGKANYLLFLSTLLLTLATTARGRRVIFNRGMAVAIVVTLVCCGGYLHWMADNKEIVFASTGKFKLAEADYHLRGMVSLGRAILFFLFPFWLFFIVLFPAAIRPGNIGEKRFGHHFAGRFLLLSVAVLLTVVLAFKVTYVKDRWLQPILFCAPLFLFAQLPPEQLESRRFRLFFGSGLVAMAVICTVFTLRIVAAGWQGENGNFSRVNYPFQAMAAEIRSQGFDGGLILSNKRFLAGNMRLLFPGSTALIPGYHLETRLPLPEKDKVLLLWMPAESKKMPKKLRRFADSLGVNMKELTTTEIRHRRLYSRTPAQVVRLGVALGSRSGN